MSRNVSEPLRGPRQTNQRAELTAVARALDHVPIDRAVLIHTDSNYSIKCLTEWFQNWEKRNWKSSSGKDVENRDLIEPILARIRERERCRANTSFKWIKGHSNDPGNIAADHLAVHGSRNSTPEVRDTDFRTGSATLNTPTTDDIKMRYRGKGESDTVGGMGTTAAYDVATDIEKIIADLDEAERAEAATRADPTAVDHVCSTLGVNHVPGEGLREGHSQFNEGDFGSLPLKTEATDALDMVQGKVEEM